MRYFARLSYLGKNYHGWQNQPNAISVQEVIEKTLTTIFRNPTQIVGAGRTDSGVHAKEMYIHFDCNLEINEKIYLYKINSLLPNDIVFINISPVTETAHARFDAISRSYEYHIYIGKNPFYTDTQWQIQQQLDIAAMNKAANYLLAYSNFKCFSKSNTDVNTYNCKITKAYWKIDQNNLIFFITADRFLRNMVRAIVGTLYNIGLGKMPPEAIHEIIQSEDRGQAGFSVPAKGLFLTKIIYPENIYHA